MGVHQPDDGTLIHHGIEYHIHEFVYVHPSRNTNLLDIGQITAVDNNNVSVTFLGRYDSFVHQQQKIDNHGEYDANTLVFDEVLSAPFCLLDLTYFPQRRLFFTNKKSIISADKLDGICHVFHLTDEVKIESWIQHDDHYYLNQEGSRHELSAMSKIEFQYCKPCHLKDKEGRMQIERFKRTNSKAVGMELFSGMPLLLFFSVLLGLILLTIWYLKVQVVWELVWTYLNLWRQNMLWNFHHLQQKHICKPLVYVVKKTLRCMNRQNHPNTIVYCQDTNALLKHVIDHTPPLCSLIDGKTLCPPLPDRQKEPVDFIFGGLCYVFCVLFHVSYIFSIPGPPCQSFSFANHSKVS